MIVCHQDAWYTRGCSQSSPNQFLLICQFSSSGRALVISYFIHPQSYGNWFRSGKCCNDFEWTWKVLHLFSEAIRGSDSNSATRAQFVKVGHENDGLAFSRRQLSPRYNPPAHEAGWAWHWTTRLPFYLYLDGGGNHLWTSEGKQRQLLKNPPRMT